MLLVVRLMIALGVVVAAVGFTLLGMATSYVYPDPSSVWFGAILMVVGLVAFAIGFVVHRSIDEPDRSAN